MYIFFALGLNKPCLYDKIIIEATKKKRRRTMTDKISLPYPTPHINAKPEDFAKTVLMPGDPLRAKLIAEKYIEKPKLINEVRGMLGYTGSYKGKPVTVFASGMGMPSMGIYAYELYNFFGVERIIRIGTAGALTDKVNIADIIIAEGACTNSDFAKKYGLLGTYAPIADFSLLFGAYENAKALGVPFHVGNVLTSDHFYTEQPSQALDFAKMGVLCTEMETAALYMTAARAGKAALAMLTISDSLVTGETTTSEERRTKLGDMIKIALETAARF